MLVPTEPKIYHITPVDRLASIVSNGHLWSDAEARKREVEGTTIGISSIKERRLRLPLNSHKGLRVGDCAPFYFCPRSVMLYVLHKANSSELTYRGGEGPIVHLQADLRQAVAWADATGRRWAFTSSNAGARYFEDYADLDQLAKVDWDAVQAHWWSGPSIDPTVQDRKQAEFLIEHSFAWTQVSRIGVASRAMYYRVQNVLQGSSHRPALEIKPGWYY